MNGIVRVTKKPANPIDVLRSALAKEARRLSNALDSQSWSGLDTLAENVAAAEVLVVTPEYQALIGVLRAALAPASVENITHELTLVFACYPAKDLDISVLIACAVDEVSASSPVCSDCWSVPDASAANANSDRASPRLSKRWTTLIRQWSRQSRSSFFLSGWRRARRVCNGSSASS
jgi:hypothetical protein